MKILHLKPRSFKLKFNTISIEKKATQKTCLLSAKSRTNRLNTILEELQWAFQLLQSTYLGEPSFRLNFFLSRKLCFYLMALVKALGSSFIELDYHSSSRIIWSEWMAMERWKYGGTSYSTRAILDLRWSIIQN